MVLDNIVSLDENMQLPRTLDSRKSYKKINFIRAENNKANDTFN